MNKNKLGFTLAEVLITLGVIGVISAMTIPSVINKYKNYVIKKQFAKTYSILSQALNKVVYENGMTVPVCYYNTAITTWQMSECQLVQDEFLKQLKIIKICNNKAFQNGCIAEYKSNYEMSGYPNFDKYHINNLNPAYVLADGTILLGYADWKFPIVFAVDFNGKKLPNKFGYDIFAFVLYNSNGKFVIGPNGQPVETGGKTTSQMLKELNLSD